MRSKEDSPRLPLLPGAGPAAAPRRRGLAGRDPRRACRSCRRPAGRATSATSGCRPYDAAVLVGEPRATRAVRGALAPPAPALDAEGARELGDRRVPRPAQDRSRGRRPRRRRPSSPTSSGGSRRGELSGTNAKEVFAAHAATARRSRRSSSAAGSARSRTPAALGARRRRGHRRQPEGASTDYRAGKPVLGFFVGQVMKATRGQANAALVQDGRPASGSTEEPAA